MAKFIAILLIASNAISYSTAQSSSSNPLIDQIQFSPLTQGGFLEFSNSTSVRFENSVNNSDSIILSDYTGLPLKALQLKILVSNSRGKLKLTSVSRGSSIPVTDFLFDYEIYTGELEPDGSSIDEVRVVILGNGENILLPKQIHNILCINYDIRTLDSELDSSTIILTEVLGATASPVQDANIMVRNEKNIYLNKAISVTDKEVTLQQNYPNPFNPSTKISFELKNSGITILRIFNSIGEVVATLVNEYMPAGKYDNDFNASNLSSGIYYCQIITESSTDIKKMILLK